MNCCQLWGKSNGQTLIGLVSKGDEITIEITIDYFSTWDYGKTRA
jgi:hypothetical protein